jgi:predicted TPR repeat methyltransferase
MLARARDRGCYDELVEGELTAYLTSTGGAFDLITAGDVLCYLGDLAPVMAAASGALRPRGWLMFTVEAASDGAPTPYVLHPHGRYCHREDFLRRSLAAAGLAVVALDRAHLRVELKRPVDGYLVVARRS